MDCKILSIVKKDFDSLWNCQQKGETVVITTPFSHAFSKLINIYITERNNSFVISEGGDLFSIIKSENMNWQRVAIQKAIGHFLEKFEIKISPQQGKAVPIYYIKVQKPEEISSGVFNMVNFVSAVTNFTSSLIPSDGEDAEEKKNREIFETDTEGFLRETYKGHDLNFNPKIKSFTPSVLIDAAYSIQYITGARPKTFCGETGTASLMYKGLEDLHLIKSFVAYIDDSADGFSNQQSQQFVEMLSMPKVFRSQPQTIKEYIPV